MVAIVTLRVNNCDSGSALSGAAVTDGYNTVYTNAYGEISVAWDNTVYVGYSVAISKSGFQSRQINLYNSQNGTTVTTCLNPSSSGGGSTGGGSSGGGSGICFIVTAATGSPLSDEVQMLRGLRDEIAARAPAAGRLIDEIYDEYWQFSPALANRISADGLLRQGTLMAAVQPLLAWYGLASALALGRDVGDLREEMRQACSAAMPSGVVADLIGRVRRDRAVPPDAPEALRNVADHLVNAANLPMVDWAILWPLETCWTLTGDQSEMDSAIADWLAHAPAGPLTKDGPDQTACALELLDFDPAAQARLQKRLSVE